MDGLLASDLPIIRMPIESEISFLGSHICTVSPPLVVPFEIVAEFLRGGTLPLKLSHLEQALCLY